MTEIKDEDIRRRYQTKTKKTMIQGGENGRDKR